MQTALLTEHGRVRGIQPHTAPTKKHVSSRSRAILWDRSKGETLRAWIQHQKHDRGHFKSAGGHTTQLWGREISHPTSLWGQRCQEGHRDSICPFILWSWQSSFQKTTHLFSLADGRASLSVSDRTGPSNPYRDQWVSEKMGKSYLKQLQGKRHTPFLCKGSAGDTTWIGRPR